MCGIIGYVGTKEVLPILMGGLRLLEYRGYDSAGVVVFDGKRFRVEKAPGKLQVLASRVARKPLEGTLGLGHTRWATHGGVTEANAHPHLSCDERIAIVHNGIIENYVELKKRLRRHKFRSETDTEIVAHLVEEKYSGDPRAAVLAAVRELRGAYALVIAFARHPDRLYGARLNAPLVVGLDSTESLLASDLHALLPHTRRVAPVEEGRVVELTRAGVRSFDLDGREQPLKPFEVEWSAEAAEKSGYSHFMLKEIHEQADTTAQELQGRLDRARNEVVFEDLGLDRADFRRVRRVVIAACGTSWHAGTATKYGIEEFARLPVDCALASELRYGDYPFDRHTLMLAFSQSGETADTLAAVRMAREAGAKVLAITNIRGSSIARESDAVVYMRARLEVGVAATKTYTSQMMCGLLLGMQMGRWRGMITGAHMGVLMKTALQVPGAIQRVLEDVAEIKRVAERFKKGYDFMYIGRRYNLATAYEGALKMKEISYLHAEGYGAGEMKHGPLALVDDHLTTLAIAPQGRVYEKMVSNIQQVASRKGHVVSVGTDGDALLPTMSEHVLWIPAVAEVWSPVVSVVPLQLLAYYTAVALGRDVDQPRNLAKSVTVE
ncbi:MAG: glutamine--fructose-6-phosphate transaminase (isomerizing) [Planctomycetes bacterium]|nr:glutamine--fructose-6-phosphate transaminase (isomerizing) [Planctomycetota bacterium]